MQSVTQSAPQADDAPARNWRKPSRSYSNGNCVQVANWRKSQHSHANGNCAEVAAWRKSAHSGHNGQCVEAGHAPGVIGVRDTKLGEASPVLEFTPDAWQAFLGSLRALRNRGAG